LKIFQKNDLQYIYLIFRVFGMAQKRSILIFSVLIFSSVLFSDAYAHSMFNSAEKFESGFRVQVATSPEFPQIDEPSQFRVRVTEGFDYEEVDRFTMGIRIFFNGQQVDTIPPIEIEGSHWDFDYVWRSQGNHIVLVDLYDMIENQEIHTYTFNMGTQNPFGYIFFGAIIVGALTLTVVVLYIYLPKSFKKSKD
jgi:hypothetical protein